MCVIDPLVFYVINLSFCIFLKTYCSVLLCFFDCNLSKSCNGVEERQMFKLLVTHTNTFTQSVTENITKEWEIACV